MDLSYKREVTNEFTPPAGKSAADAKQEWAQCNLSTGTTQGSANQGVYDDIFRLCMEAKGWTWNGPPKGKK